MFEEMMARNYLLKAKAKEYLESSERKVIQHNKVYYSGLFREKEPVVYRSPRSK